MQLSSRATLMALCFVLARCTPSSTTNVAASGSSGAQSTQCDLRGTWRMRAAPVCASSQWTFEAPSTDGSVRVREEGCGGVSGTGRWQGGQFVIEGVTTDSATAMFEYRWTLAADCNSAGGTITPSGGDAVRGSLTRGGS
ncbi:MAG: hypothetical protein JNK05_04985 [Myxococcales bacterium]|nr:hypothetical protein [Myxococcales bacterium]